MLGDVNPQTSMFSYVDLESRIPEHHPIRKVRQIVDKSLDDLEPAFEAMHAALTGEYSPWLALQRL